jgi:hypothetical protein
LDFHDTRSAKGLTWSDMDPNQNAERTFTGLKSTLVQDHGVGTDIPITLMTCRGHHLIGCYPLHDTEHRGVIIAAAILLSDADRAYVGADVYYEHVDHPDVPPPGDLARRFAMGDRDVCEAIQIACVPEHGPATNIFRTYRYDGRSVRWEERIEVDGLTNYVSALQLAFRHRADHPVQPSSLITPGTQVHLLGEGSLDGDIGLLFALSLGCPCGSGRAIGDCCSVRN